MSKKNMTKKKAFENIALYIVSIDYKEFEDYTRYCEESIYCPSDIQGEHQRKHVYAQALIALGRKYTVY